MWPELVPNSEFHLPPPAGEVDGLESFFRPVVDHIERGGRRATHATDRVVLATARRAPGLLRLVSRISARR